MPRLEDILDCDILRRSRLFCGRSEEFGSSLATIERNAKAASGFETDAIFVALSIASAHLQTQALVQNDMMQDVPRSSKFSVPAVTGFAAVVVFLVVVVVIVSVSVVPLGFVVVVFFVVVVVTVIVVPRLLLVLSSISAVEDGTSVAAPMSRQRFVA